VRRLLTSAIITVPEHDHVTDRPPRTRRQGLPPSSGFTRAALRLAALCWPSFQWIRGRIRFSAQAAPPRRARRGKLRPDPDWLEHLLSRAHVHAGWRSQHRYQGQVPASTPANDASAVRARATSPVRPRRGPGSAHPRCHFVRERLRRAGSSGPQVVTNLWSNRCGAFGIDVSSQRR
jgi:hypothetical protein